MADHAQGTRCGDCDCATFEGPPDAIYCMACGHARDRHAGGGISHATEAQASDVPEPTQPGTLVADGALIVSGARKEPNGSAEAQSEGLPPTEVASTPEAPESVEAAQSNPAQESSQCRECDCRAFIGPHDGVYCMECGHQRAFHGVSRPVDATPDTGPLSVVGSAGSVGEAANTTDAHQQATQPPVARAEASAAPHQDDPGCQECGCDGFVGPTDAAYCSRCGHHRDAHMTSPVTSATSFVISPITRPASDTAPASEMAELDGPATAQRFDDAPDSSPAGHDPIQLIPVLAVADGSASSHGASQGAAPPIAAADRSRHLRIVAVLAVLGALALGGVAAALVATSGGSDTSAHKTAGGNTSGGSSTENSGASISAFTVSRIVNGDALWLDQGRTKVRLLQIDAPDVATKDCYATQSLAALQALAPPGTAVTMKRDPRFSGRDQFGRLVRYVFVAGRNLNLELVKRGAAAPYFFFGHRGRYSASLLEAARAARSARRGLWGACPGTPFDPNHEVHTGS